MKSRELKRAIIYIVDVAVILLSIMAFVAIEQKAALPQYLFTPGVKPDQPLKTGKGIAPLPLEWAQQAAKGQPTTVIVAGDTVSAEDELEFLLDGYKPGDTVTVIQHAGSVHLSRRVSLLPTYSSRYLVVHVFVSLAFFFLGLLVYFRRPDDKGALFCHWLTMTSGAAIATQWSHYDPTGFDWTWVIRGVFAVAYCMRPLAVLHFTLVFPHDKSRRSKFILYPLYVIGSVLAIASFVFFVIAAKNGTVDDVHRYSRTYIASMIFSVIVSLSAVVVFIHSYRTSTDSGDKRRIMLTLVGFAIALAGYVFLWQVPTILGHTPLIAAETMLLFVLCAPIAIVISILKYKIFDIDRLLSRAYVYVIVLIGLFAIYALFLGAISTLFGKDLYSGSAVGYIVAIAFLGILFEPLRSKVQTIVDKRFFRVRYNYREAQRAVGRDLQNAVDPHVIARSVVDQLNELLQPERIALVIEQGRTTEVLAQRPGDASNDISIELLREVTLQEQLGMKEIVESDAQIAELAPAYRSSPYKLFVSLSADATNVVGALALGAKRSDQRYSVQDIDLLRTIAQQAGLAIERIRLTEELIEQRTESQRLKELSDFKSFIVNSISHDLKTPISSIRLYAQLLHRGILKQGEQKRLEEFIDIIEGESSRLTALIDNVLDHGRIERGVMQYQKSIVELNVTVNDVLRSLMYLLQLQGFASEVQLSATPLYVFADPTSVQNILINLITNAVKYSKDDKHIEISTRSRDGKALITISDRGIGIPSDQIHDIFLPFFRVDNNNEGLQARGVGLGLSNVKSMMANHDGSCEVESTIGRGTTFTLSFPLMHELTTDHLTPADPIHA